VEIAAEIRSVGFAREMKAEMDAHLAVV